MALLIEDLKENKLYRKELYLPSNPKNKRKGSVIFMMTPDYKSSVKSMNLPYLLNGGRYESYYTEKDISFVLTEDHYLMENSDDICITENSIPQYTRINCSSKEELVDVGVFNNDDIPEPFNAQVYIDDRKKVYGWFVVTNNGSTLYKVEAYSFQMRQDLIKSVMIFFDPKTVMIWDESDRRVFAKHGFKNIKYTAGANVMVREEAILTEGIGQTKLNIEIALWKAQINITETILNNFNDENWMKHMYKKLKRMLNKTPLPGYADDLDDSLDSIKNKLNNQKATLAFYTELGAMELKESLDISDIITEYITWVEKLSCPKALKIKILNEVISAYKLSIRECEYNLARYRALDDSKKRLDNGLALIGKLTSAFSFITEGPLSIIKGMVLKSILPKTRKKSVLSEEELEAKIKLYTSIVEVLEDKKKEIGSLKESTGTNIYSRPYTRKEILDNYGKDIHDKLMKDPAHAFRADTGIELIHQEPSKDELDRIMDEWNKMSNSDKKKSDEMSIKLFGKDNKSHFKELITIYESSSKLQSFKRILMNKLSIAKYKPNCKFLSHFRSEENGPYLGYIWLDEDTVVAACSVNTETKYIQAIEIVDKYRGRGLSYEILKVCESLGANKLSVNKNNPIAKHVYDNSGYKVIDSTDSMHMMQLTEAGKTGVPSDIIAFNKELNKYDYGVLIKGKVETDMDSINFGKDYRTISVSDFAKYKAGVCWDFANYEAKWFKSHGYEYRAYYLELNDNNMMPTHTFILFKIPNSNKVYYFESSWFKYQGIEAFDTESEALITITNRHRKNNGNFPASMYMYDTAGLDKNLTVREFMKKAKQKEIFREGVSSYRMSSLTEDTSMTDKYLYDGGTNITFLEGNDEILTESPDYNAELRKILYAERIKNNKEILNLYDQVKADCPFIKYTYIDYARYAEKNLFIDWSYYTQAFFKNNIRKYDKAVDLFVEFSNRFIDDTRLEPLGYNQKVILVPVDDWLFDSSREMWDYKQNLNPISIIYRLLFRDPTKLQTEWGGHTFLFTGKHGYFKMNFSMFERKNLGLFLQNIKTLINDGIITDDPNEPTNSIGGIVNKVVDALENKSTIQINNLTGATSTTPEELMDKLNNPNIISSDHTDTEEEKLVAAITKAAETSTTPDEVMDKIDNDEYIKQIIIDLKNTNPNGVSIDPTRAARMRKLDDSFSKKQIAGKTVRELLNNDNDMPLEETTLPIDSINDEWKHMTFMNHGKSYDLNSDIISCLYHFANTTEPFGIRDISQENTSTSEDWVSTWTVQCEDARGKRFTLKFDIPELKNNRFMHLRGNDKTINGQLMNLPIIKTDRDTCQMTSNYNKIFFTGYGSSVGKSYVVADRIIKTLNKMEKNPDMEIMYGDNSLICSKYELPSDYIDIASSISKITYYNRHIKTKYTYFFNQDEFLEKYGNKVKEEEGFAIGIMESDSIKGEAIIYTKIDIPVSYFIYDMLSTNETFADIYNTTNLSVRYTYSKASILNTDIPVAVIIGYYIGLIAMLDRAEIKYTISSSRPKYDKNLQDLIKLSDAFIVYDLDYNSSMLLNGLKECDLASYSLTEVNNKKMWVECLDNFGGRLKADGLDMFLDLMMDPITKVVCKKYQLPTEFIDALLYSNMLLSDNKYNQHTNVNGNRYRTLEVIAGYTYKALCNSYTQYRRDLRSGRDAKMTMKQTAVLDMLFADSTFSDLSALSDLLELETSNSTSWKGLSGMNSERAFGLDKRTYDASMINVLALSTGFAGNAGVNRQSTIDMSIDSARGYIKNTSDDSMSITKTFCMAEALTPMGTTSDDPFRSAMTFVQTTKHNMRVRNGDPLLITNGADEALPYLTSNTFTHKAKEAGRVKIKTDDYMVLEYMNKITEVVDLRERILKNSDGGMYIAVQLETDLKEGNMFSEMEIVAVDKSSYTGGVGPNNGLAYNIGTFVKFTIINSDEGFEDSCIETEWMAKAMSSVVVINKEYTIPKDTNVHFIAKKGQSIQEGDPLLIFQNSFDEEDANMLIKTLSDEDGSDIVEELGRIPITSKVTGVIKDIKITRTVEKEELSPSLLKVVNAYEKDIKSFTKILDQYDKKQARTSDATYKLSTTGRLKNAKDSVRIEFSIAYDDDFSIGDKTVLYSALKGVSKGIIPAGDESYSEFRPDEKIHYIQSTNGDMKRMVGSIIKTGALNKVMVELHRKSCDIMGIKWKYFDEY